MHSYRIYATTKLSEFECVHIFIMNVILRPKRNNNFAANVCVCIQIWFCCLWIFYVQRRRRQTTTILIWKGNAFYVFIWRWRRRQRSWCVGSADVRPVAVPCCLHLCSNKIYMIVWDRHRRHAQSLYIPNASEKHQERTKSIAQC